MVYFLNYFNSDVWNILRSRNDNLVCVTQDDSKVHFQSKIILTGEVRVLTPSPCMDGCLIYSSLPSHNYQNIPRNPDLILTTSGENN